MPDLSPRRALKGTAHLDRLPLEADHVHWRKVATSTPRQRSHPSRWEASRSDGRSRWVRLTIVSAPSATNTTSTVLLPGGSVASSGIPQVKTTRWGGSTAT